MTQIPLFDSHSDTVHVARARGRSLRENDMQLDFIRSSAFQPRGQVFSVWGEPRRDPPMFEKVMDYWEQELAANADRVRHCRSAADIRKAHQEGKIAALLSIEGAEQIGCRRDRLQEVYDRGVRIIHPCWNYDNVLTGSATESRRGLTEEGRRFVEDAQRIGIIIDLSHSSEKAFWDVLEMTTKPVLAGHSDSRAVLDNPRNLTDEQFIALAKLGGVAGLNLSGKFIGGAYDVDAVVDHAEHFLSLGGEKAVGLGTDLDGVPELPKGLRGVQDFGKLYEAMLRRNWSESLVRGIFFDNLNEFFTRAL